MDAANIWQRNLTLLNTIAFSRMFLLIMPIFVPLMSHYGLSMQQTMLLQTVFGGTTLLCELPSGYLADLYGRRNILILGTFLAGLGFSVLLFADQFWELALFEALLGLSFSLCSGTDTSLVFESEQALGRPGDGKAISHQLSWMNFGEAVASIFTTILMIKGFTWVIVVQVIVGWVPFFCSFGLRDAPRTRSDLSHRENTKAIWDSLSKNRQIPVLVLLFIGTMSFTWLVAWFNQPLWLNAGLDVAWFGLVWGSECLVIAVVARSSNNVRRWFSGWPVWWLIAVVMLVAWLFISQSATLAGLLIGAYLAAAVRGCVMPWIKDDLNQQVDNTYRATVNSVVGTSFRLFTIGLGPLFGWVIDSQGVVVATQWLLPLVIPTVLILVWWGNTNNRSAQESTEVLE